MNKISESKIGNKNPAWRGGPIERVCQSCGNVFLAIRAKVPGNAYSNRTRAKSKYCSRECSTEAQKKDKIKKNCIVCLIEFEVIPAKAKSAKYCSVICRTMFHRKPTEHCQKMQKKHDHLRYARENAAEGQFTEEEWSLLKRQYHHRCLCCGRQEPDIKLTKDHIIPLTKGGSNWIWNIQPLCRSCNSKKQNRIIKYDYIDNDMR